MPTTPTTPRLTPAEQKWFDAERKMEGVLQEMQELLGQLPDTPEVQEAWEHWTRTGSHFSFMSCQMWGNVWDK